MIPAINNLLLSVYRAQNPDTFTLNILTACLNNEKYIGLLSHTQHNFYILPQHKWNDLIEIRPQNVQTITDLAEPLDYIICYNRAEQYNEMATVAHQLQVPLILVDLCSKPMIRPQHILEQMKPIDLNHFNRSVALQVYSTSHIEQSWDNQDPSTTIPIGIDTNKFNDQQTPNEIYVAMDNNTASQVGEYIHQQIKNLFPVWPTDHDKLQNITVNKTRYFINTYKTITVKTLEAMAAGNIVICLQNHDTSNFIKNRETGILLNKFNELNNALQTLEQSPDLRKTIAEQARKQIVTNHSLEQFVKKWLAAFDMIKSVLYTPLQ